MPDYDEEAIYDSMEGYYKDSWDEDDWEDYYGWYGLGGANDIISRAEAFANYEAGLKQPEHEYGRSS